MSNQAPSINDPKVQDYIERVGAFTLSNLKRKGYTKQQVIELMALPDFTEKCMKAYNDSFENWANKPETKEILAEMVHAEANKG